MNKPTSPCFGCTKRFVGCHSECEAYKAFHEQTIEYLRDWKQLRFADHDVDTYRYLRNKKISKQLKKNRGN